MPRFTVSDGTSLYYEDLGEGRPIVFVHGGGATHALWEQQVVELADEFRTVVFDHRGCGASDTPRGAYTVDRYADDLAELIAGLGLEGATVVTHGIGGHITLRAVHRHPEMCERLVLCAAAPWFAGDKDGAGGFSDEFLEALMTGSAANFPESEWRIIDQWLFHTDPGLATKVAALGQAVSWSVYAHRKLSQSLQSVDHRPYLPEITQRALVAHGVHDRKNRFEGSAHLATLLPNARLERFEESSHAVFADERAKFNEVVAAFVRE